jgi:hypothetical protein
MTTATKRGTEGTANGVHQRSGSCTGQPLGTVGTAAPEPAAEVKNHGANGRFVPGNKAARGNPNARRAASWRNALLRTLDEDKLAVLGEKLYEAALQGDWQAAKLLLSYAIGKAPEAVDGDRLDLDEWAIANAMPSVGQFLRAFADGMKVAEAVAYHQHHENVGNNPAKVIERLNEEVRHRPEYSPPGPLTSQLLAEMKEHVGK